MVEQLDAAARAGLPAARYGVDAGAALGGRIYHEAAGLPQVVVGGGKHEVRHVFGLEAPGVLGVGLGEVLALKVGLADDGGEGIFALGECAEHRGICYGLVEPCYEQRSDEVGPRGQRDGARETYAADLAVERQYPNPRQVTRSDIRELLEAALRGDANYISSGA